MSLILDALKKSDRNRDRGKVPDLQADHSSIVAPPPPLRRYRRWLWSLLVLVVVAGGGLLWQLRPSSTASVATPLRQPVSIPALPLAPPAAPASAPVTAPLEPAVTTVAAKVEAAAAANPKLPPAAKSPASSPAADNPPAAIAEVYELAALPPHIAQGLPELTVSVHYYTPNPESRMVRINNRILREGGSLSGGIKIIHIEKNGIICEIQGVRFRLPTTTLAVDRREEDK